MNEDTIDRFVALMMRFHQLGEEDVRIGDLEISPAQVVYIDHLARCGSATLKDLSEGLGLRPASVSVMVRELEKKGLVERRTNPNDKRSILLTLSEKGQRVFKRLDNHRRAKARSLLANLKQEEQRQWLKLFEQLLIKK